MASVHLNSLTPRKSAPCKGLRAENRLRLAVQRRELTREKPRPCQGAVEPSTKAAHHDEDVRANIPTLQEAAVIARWPAYSQPQDTINNAVPANLHSHNPVNPDNTPSTQPSATQKTRISLASEFIRQGQRYVRDNERLLVVAASTMLMSISHTALRPVLPLFTQGFGVGAAACGMTLSAYALARLAANIPAGLLADRHGRKPLLVLGPAITALGMIGCGISGSFQELLAWRFVTGVGSAVQMAGAHLFLADISATGNRARNLGTNQAAALFGSLIGPAVGGFLADQAGLRAPFTVTGVAALGAGLYGMIRLPETKSSLQVNAGNSAQSGPKASPGANSIKKEAIIKKRSSKRRAAWKLLMCPDFRAIAIVNAVMFMTSGARSVLMPLLAVQGFGLTPTILGLMFAGMAVVSLLGVMPAAAAADKMGRKWTIVPSGLLLAASLMLMAMTGRLDVFSFSAAMYAMGYACIGASPAAYAADVSPSDHSGLGLGIFRSAGDIGLMVGPAVLGLVADMTSVHTALQVNALVVTLTIAYFALNARETSSELERKAQLVAQPT